MPPHTELGRPHSTGLVEVLDRVLDKGLFVGGDVKISLAEVELLTIRIRLIVCSLDKAREIGLDWWTYDKHLSPGRAAAANGDDLERRVRELEAQLARQVGPAPPAAGRVRSRGAKPRRAKRTR
jgi:hypothetical protein